MLNPLACPADQQSIIPSLPLAELEASYMARLHDPVVFISAQKKENIEALRELLGRKVAELYQVRYPYANGAQWA